MFAGQRMCDMDFGLVEAQPKKERKKERMFGIVSNLND